jgi:hypothetical protein
MELLTPQGIYGVCLPSLSLGIRALRREIVKARFNPTRLVRYLALLLSLL